MTCRAAVFAGVALVLAWASSPAAAHESWRQGHGGHWRATRGAIYEMGNRIAFLEADPEIDDGYKGPIIIRARANINELRATFRPAYCRWASPCCYSRRPIRIR